MKEHRKLAAIMFTDIVGYTSLMSKDEKKALDYLHKNRDIVKLLVGQFNGEFLESIGDGTLSTFNSVVDAVNCALEIQNTLKGEAELKLRIGIHLGDVIVEDGAVFGDGVNVASRIQNLAEAGGVCISERVYYDIKNKPELKATFLGEKKLKNVDDMVKVYSLTRGGAGSGAAGIAQTEQKKHIKFPRWLLYASMVIIALIIGAGLFVRFGKPHDTTAPAQKQEQIPSIAVLAFDDMSPDKDQEYFCDGISEEILNRLANVSRLNVIARTSSFMFKGKDTSVKVIGESLGADYILEGSIRKADDRLRITAQLIRAADQYHVFSEMYDRTMDDIFAIQEDISLAIVDSLRVRLLGNEQKMIADIPTDNKEAYDVYLQGLHLWNENMFRNRETVKSLFEKAIELDPDFALPYAALAYYYCAQAHEGKNVVKSFAMARRLALKSIDLDENCAAGYTQLSNIQMSHDWDWEGAERSLQKAIDLNPGSVEAHYFYSTLLVFLNKYDQSNEEMKKAVQLNPLSRYHRNVHFFQLLRSGYFDEAMNFFDDDPETRNYQLNWIYLKKGELDKVWKYMEPYLDEMKKTGNNWQIILFPLTYYEKEIPFVKKVLKKINFDDHPGYKLYSLCRLYIKLGEKEKAIELLEELYPIRHPNLRHMHYKGAYELLHDVPIYQELIKELNLPMRDSY